MDYVTLNNGVKMPQLGYGVYQTPPEETERCVLAAIKNGYRSIDTAQAYGNEEGVGQAIVKCSLPREELFITTKIWISNAGYEKAKDLLQGYGENFSISNAFDVLRSVRQEGLWATRVSFIYSVAKNKVYYVLNNDFKNIAEYQF